jgi:hypothetical protein
MHVRIAWEIHNNQMKQREQQSSTHTSSQQSSSSASAADSKKSLQLTPKSTRDLSGLGPPKLPTSTGPGGVFDPLGPPTSSVLLNHHQQPQQPQHPLHHHNPHHPQHPPPHPHLTHPSFNFPPHSVAGLLPPRFGSMPSVNPSPSAPASGVRLSPAPDQWNRYLSN